jgi:hypothetical protein
MPNDLAQTVSTLEPADQVHAWILEGASEYQIAEAIEHLWPGTKPNPLMIAAMKRIAAAAEVNQDCLIGWCIEATRTVYQRAMAAGDYGAALRAVKQLHTFAGRVDHQ